jgi:hypothetical protein
MFAREIVCCWWKIVTDEARQKLLVVATLREEKRNKKENGGASSCETNHQCDQRLRDSLRPTLLIMTVDTDYPRLCYEYHGSNFCCF